MNSAIIVAAGKGVRMGVTQGGIDKLFLEVAGRPLVAHTWQRFNDVKCVDEIVMVVRDGMQPEFTELAGKFSFRKRFRLVVGGAERQESVWRGLQALPPSTRWVVVHDAVRPFITAHLVGRVLAAARAHGAATCGLAVRETVKRVRDSVIESTVDRDGLWLTQTPQAFRREILWEAHDKSRRDGYQGTDDAVLVERLGGRVAMVAGPAQNLKVTTPEDLEMARLWLARRGRRA